MTPEKRVIYQNNELTNEFMNAYRPILEEDLYQNVEKKL